MPKVSIVIPVFNVEGYLVECLDSALAQTLSDIEVVCVDDGSTDGCPAIMADYAKRDPRVHVVTKANAGYGAGVNDGFAASTGDWLTVLEPDDVFPLDACEAMWTFATENDLDFLKADARVFVGEAGERSYTPAPTNAGRSCYEKVSSSAADPIAFAGRSGQPAMYRRNFIEGNAIRLNESPGAAFQDTGIWAQCVFCGHRVRYLDHPCYDIRRDNPNSSESRPDKVDAIRGEYAFIRASIERLPGVVDAARCRQACTYYEYISYEWNLGRISDEACEGFLANYAADFRALDEEGSLERAYFSAEELARLDRVMADPEAEYWRDYGYRGELARLRDEVDRLARENAALKAKVDDVYNSKSYQLGHALGTPARVARGKKEEG